MYNALLSKYFFHLNVILEALSFADDTIPRVVDDSMKTLITLLPFKEYISSGVFLSKQRQCSP